MGSAFHQLCPRYSGTLTPTAPTAIRLWETFTFTFFTTMREFFYQGSGELQHFKRFCFEKNIYCNDLPFHAKDDEPHNQSFCYMFMQYTVRFANANLPKRTPNLQHILFYSCGHARP